MEGFLNISVLETLLANVVTYPGQLRIIPQLSFLCSGSLSGLIIGGKRSTAMAESGNLRVGLWTCTLDSTAISGKDCERANAITISSQQLLPMTGSPNVYEIMFKDSVGQLNQTLALGIEQGAATANDVSLYYQQGTGPINYYIPYVSPTSPGVVSLSNFMNQMDHPLLYPLYGE